MLSDILDGEQTGSIGDRDNVHLPKQEADSSALDLEFLAHKAWLQDNLGIQLQFETLPEFFVSQGLLEKEFMAGGSPIVLEGKVE